MQREGYWDYMGRRMREDGVLAQLSEEKNSLYMYGNTNYLSPTKKEQSLYRRIEELERKVALLISDHPKQLELDI